MNAKEEFLRVIRDYEVIGAKISFGGSWNDEKDANFFLPLLYTDEQYQLFLKFLDREYDDGYGGQNLFGDIICENGVWMDRGEYDGSEWWNVHEYPNLSTFFGDKLALKYFRKKKLDEIKKIGE